MPMQLTLSNTLHCFALLAMAVAGLPAGAQTAPQLQVDPFWPKPLPNNWLLGQVSGVAVDSRDHIWIVQRPASLSERELGAAQSPPLGKCCVAAPPVLVFDQSGNLVRAWGGPGTGYEWPASEHGIFVDETDAVWLAGNGDNDSQLLKFTLDRQRSSCRSAGAGNREAATTRPTSAARPTSASTSRRARCTSPTAIATAASSCSIR